MVKRLIYLFLDIDKLKYVPNNLINLKSKVDELDNHKLVNVLIGLSKLSDLVKMMLLKRVYILLRSKILNLKYLILLI